MKNLTIQEIEHIAFRFAQQHLAFNEPIPDFATRFPEKLESCIAMPFMKFDKQDLYKGLLHKAAMLFYLIVKNHPFQNGNKRMAIMATLVFLSKNRKWVSANIREMYDLTIWAASSPPKLKDATVQGIQDFLEKNVKNVE